jgi:hypothetical protein
MKGKLAAQFSGSSNDAPAPSRRGRVRSADFGMPERQGLLDLARTYLETQTRLWPDLVGTAAVPAADAATIAAMADDFERRFRAQVADIFQPGSVPRAWTDIGLAYLRFSDENSNPRSLDQQLLNVLTRARRDGVFVPWQYVLADAAVSGTLAFRRGDNIQPSGVRSASTKASSASMRPMASRAARTAATSRPGSSTTRCLASSWRRSSPTASSPT